MTESTLADRLTQTPEPAEPGPTTHHVSTRLLVALGIGLLGFLLLTVYVVVQHGNLTDAEAQVVQVTEQRNTAQESLSDTEADLSSAERTLAAHETQLTACAAVVGISDHQYETALLMSKAISSTLGMDYITGTSQLERATGHVNKVNRILDDSGYSGDIEGLWAACAPDGEAL